jgi:hypothetical protein
MSMDSDSFSVLTDKQKVYKQTGRAVNPYAPEEEQMRQASAVQLSTTICVWLEPSLHKN